MKNAISTTLVAILLSACGTVNRPVIISPTEALEIQPRMQRTTEDLEDYCFNITPTHSIGIKEITTTPESFVKQNKDLLAAINGPYFGLDNRPEGLSYLSEGHHFATQKPQHIRGYFTINKNGTDIKISENLNMTLKDYFLVIGTHPLLVLDWEIHSQAKEGRYATIGKAQRSAIGTRTGRDICFAVSKVDLTMEGWAETLKNYGYRGAINLDGGPYSQLSIREGNKIESKGIGQAQTRSVIFEYKK